MAERQIELYQDAENFWRWRVWGANASDIVADSGEGYLHRVDALAMAASLFPGLTVKGEVADRPTWPGTDDEQGD